MKIAAFVSLLLLSIMSCSHGQDNPALPEILPDVVTQNKGIALWPEGKMPYDEITPRPSEVYDQNGHVRQVSKPEMYFCPATGPNISDACVIVCPGGGYGMIALVHEGFNTADYLTELGINVFILKYRHTPYRQPAPLADVQRAIRLARRDAAKYQINPEKIGIMGYSAGGHLAATASTMYNEKVYDLDDDREISARPDFSILIYPVITMTEKTHRGSRDNLLGRNPSQELIDKYSCEKRITTDTPPTFLVHSSDDTVVPVANSIMYYQELVKNKINAEMHIFNTGGHGYSVKGIEGQTVANWTSALENWGISLARNVLGK